MSDIVQRLRALSDAQPAHDDVCCALAEAADELDRRWREYSMLDEVCAAQAQELERLQADAIHSCSVHCQRVECVQRREIERLRQQLGMPLDTERENERLRAEVSELRVQLAVIDRAEASLQWAEADRERVELRTENESPRHLPREAMESVEHNLMCAVDCGDGSGARLITDLRDRIDAAPGEEGR